MNKPYFIAEMGVNFYDTARVLGISPLEAAKLYIDEAAQAGVDCALVEDPCALPLPGVHTVHLTQKEGPLCTT